MGSSRTRVAPKPQRLAPQELESHTVKRLTWEAEAERFARTDEPKARFERSGLRRTMDGV